MVKHKMKTGDADKKSRNSDKNTFLRSAKTCCENAHRLLDEAQMLEFEQPLATRYYLSITAQEEAAKAFLLYLVTIDALSWTPFLLRATRDHHCKQLVGIILDYIFPDFEEFLRRVDMSKSRGYLLQLPKTVADAMNILRHEKIRRWESKLWFWAEDPEYDKATLSVANGRRDKDKQRALYVELGRNGEIATTPCLVTKEMANNEFERGRRFEVGARRLIEEGPRSGWDFGQVESCLKALFSNRNVVIEAQIP